MATWNDLLGPLIYINDQRLYPLSLGLFELRTSPRGTDYGMLMAASTLMTIPVMLLFFAGQRYFIEGVTLTGMKA
jgi:multiple sugar transport system permease protein